MIEILCIAAGAALAEALRFGGRLLARIRRGRLEVHIDLELIEQAAKAARRLPQSARERDLPPRRGQPSRRSFSPRNENSEEVA